MVLRCCCQWSLFVLALALFVASVQHHRDHPEIIGEPAIEADIPIVDAHHHLIDSINTPRPWSIFTKMFSWMNLQAQNTLMKVVLDLMLPGIVDYMGTTTIFYETYLMDNLRKDFGGHKVVKTVHVEALWTDSSELGPVGESIWIYNISKQDKQSMPNAIVGHASLTSPNLELVLQGHRNISTVRGIRDMLANSNTSDVAAFANGWPMEDEEWKKGLNRLPEYGFFFEGFVYHNQLKNFAKLAKDHPKVQFILEHIGCPILKTSSFDPKQVLKEWKEGLKAVAANKNVIGAKLSGMAMTPVGLKYKKTPPSSDEVSDQIKPLIDAVIEAFGVDRCMFASNFPVDKVGVPYSTLYNAFKKATKDRPADERNKLFHDNAVRIYKL